MQKQILLFILLINSFASQCQKVGINNNRLDFNFVIITDTIVRPFTNNKKSGSEPIEAIFYPETVLPGSLLKEEIHMTRGINIETKETFESMFVANPWIHGFPIHEYKLLTVYNTKELPSKIYCYSSSYIDESTSRTIYLNKALVAIQIKDESGKWLEIKGSFNSNKKDEDFRSCVLRGYNKLNILVKLPEGDFETELRFKVLVNAPPDYPFEKYVYSNVFKGRIDKALLSEY